MLHHAAHLVSTPSVTPLSSVLQSAAARAWTRRAHISDIRLTTKKRLDTSGSSHRVLISSSRFLHKPRVTELPPMQGPTGVQSIDPDTLSEHDMNWTDPGKADPMRYLDPPAESTPLVTSTSRENVLIPQFLVPTSQKSLYRNLLRITASNSHSMKTAINYHFRYPKAFRSARSYNFLINLAIRHAAFGTAMRLLLSMREELIPANMETWKLIVRWLVRTGRWDEARERVSRVSRRLLGRQPTVKQSHLHTIPLPLWLELFGSQKHGALRYYDRRRVSAAVRYEKCGSRGPSRINLRPCPSHISPVAAMFHYQVLMKALPLLTSEIRPRIILILSRIMIETGHRQLAFSMASSYLKNLPLRIRPCHRRTILNIIHLHMCTLPIKHGLSRHFTQRRILFDFLGVCPSVKPSPMSLFLLLGSLRGSRRCGTLALQCLRKFRQQWGPHIESGMVRRRVVSLALKEGRLDIAEDILRREKTARMIKHGWRLQVEVFGDPPSRSSYKAQRRWPLRSYFSREGVENRRWSLLEKKFLRMKERSDSQKQPLL